MNWSISLLCFIIQSIVTPVLQFEKIEQFAITSPKGDESWRMFDDMVSVAEEFFKAVR